MLKEVGGSMSSLSISWTSAPPILVGDPSASLNFKDTTSPNSFSAVEISTSVENGGGYGMCPS